jgi:hypothetical protein
MGLPQIPLPSATIELGGETVEYRALSRAEAVGLKQFEDHPADAEPYMVAAALGVTTEEAATWLMATPLDEAGQLIDAIVLLSGLGNGTSPKG